ncbi:MAG: hypothetical protein ACPGUD_02530 [Parashewanella sp.]
MSTTTVNPISVNVTTTVDAQKTSDVTTDKESKALQQTIEQYLKELHKMDHGFRMFLNMLDEMLIAFPDGETKHTHFHHLLSHQQTKQLTIIKMKYVISGMDALHVELRDLCKGLTNCNRSDLMY